MQIMTFIFIGWWVSIKFVSDSLNFYIYHFYILTDHISEVLEKLLQHELEEENAEEESVFNNTITFQWGQEIARRVRNNSEKTNSNNSQEDLQTDINVNVINSQVDTHSQTDSALPKVLQIYNDMGQEE